MKDFLLPLRRIHGRLYDRKCEKERLREILDNINNIGDGNVFFVLTPTHGNLGDHAIACAAAKIIRSIFNDYLEITYDDLVLMNKYNRIGSMDGNIIIVNGGGNLGTLWPKVELLFRSIIINNPNSDIICLPNTAFYEDTDYGNKELQESIEIYNAQKKLVICARERVSYDFIKEKYNDVVLIPDLVLSLNESIDNNNIRSGCILCLRNDIEKTLTESEQKQICSIVDSLFDEIKVSDMNIRRSVSIAQRESVLNSKFDEFRHAEVVITDRLHGMIFAAITGTPCVVLESKSHKVKSSYQWIKDLDYILFCDKIESLADVCLEVRGKASCYDNSMLEPYYNKLFDIMLSIKNSNLNDTIK